MEVDCSCHHGGGAGLQCGGVSVSKRQLLLDERDSGSYPWSVGVCLYLAPPARSSCSQSQHPCSQQQQQQPFMTQPHPGGRQYY